LGGSQSGRAVAVALLRRCPQARLAQLQPFAETCLRKRCHRRVEPHDNVRQAALVIAPPTPFNLPVVDLTELPEAEREAEARRLAEHDARMPFDFENGPLFRACLLKLAANDHLLIFNMHHIISDAWSMDVLTREVSTIYDAFSRGEPSPLPELPIQYRDFARWQRRRLQGDALDKLCAYWKGKLGGKLPVLELPMKKDRPSSPSSRGAQQRILLPVELSNNLKTLCRREGVTLFMLMLAALDVLLHRYTAQDDILVGTSIANRGRVELEGLIGFFVNTLVMRNDLSGDPAFRELLKRTREVAFEAYAHQEMPFEKLVEELNPDREQGRTPLFQVIFDLHHEPSLISVSPDLSGNAEAIDIGTTRFELTVLATDLPEGLLISFYYKTDLFEHSTISRMLESYRTLLEEIAGKPGQRLSELRMLGDAEIKPSQFPSAGLSQKELESLIMELSQGSGVKTVNEGDSA
jgi:hypothetical protein